MGGNKLCSLFYRIHLIDVAYIDISFLHKGQITGNRTESFRSGDIGADIAVIVNDGTYLCIIRACLCYNTCKTISSQNITAHLNTIL